MALDFGLACARSPIPVDAHRLRVASKQRLSQDLKRQLAKGCGRRRSSAARPLGIAGGVLPADLVTVRTLGKNMYGRAKPQQARPGRRANGLPPSPAIPFARSAAIGGPSRPALTDRTPMRPRPAGPLQSYGRPTRLYTTPFGRSLWSSNSCLALNTATGQCTRSTLPARTAVGRD